MRVLGPIIFEESRADTKRHQTAIALASPQKPQPDAKKISQHPPEQAPLRIPKLLIRLPVRVTTQELNRGRWSIRVGKGTPNTQAVEPMGRGQRVRKPRKAT